MLEISRLQASLGKYAIEAEKVINSFRHLCSIVSILRVGAKDVVGKLISLCTDLAVFSMTLVQVRSVER